MEFTKKEKKILSGKSEKQLKWNLWIGIFCIMFAIALAPIFLHYGNKLIKGWDEVHLKANEYIEPKTEQEIKLKNLHLDNIKETKQLWANYITEKSLRYIIIQLIIGTFLIVNYFTLRTYIKLINKLKISNTYKASGSQET